MSLRNFKTVATRTNRIGPDKVFEADLVELIPRLRARAMALTGKRQCAEDLAQEALAKAWRARGSFEAGTNLQAWLFTILRNERFAQVRRAWRQTPCSAEFAENVPSAADGPHWAAVLSDTSRALHCLPKEQREALLLVGAGGFSYDDAAEISSTPVGTVRSRVARARQTLKKMLASKEPLPRTGRPAKGNAVNDILGQLGLLSRAGSPMLPSTALPGAVRILAAGDAYRPRDSANDTWEQRATAIGAP